jgi:LAS superfamily LD-carboxypeptidase LdcB
MAVDRLLEESAMRLSVEQHHNLFDANGNHRTELGSGTVVASPNNSTSFAA